MAVASLLHILLFCVLAIAVVTDVRFQKIFNWLTVPALILALVVSAVGGAHVLADCLEGVAAGLGIGLLFMVMFHFGAGDAKLFIVVGALSGPMFMLWTVLYGAIAAVPFALFISWRRGALLPTLSNFATNATKMAAGSRNVTIDSNSRAGKMPYAVAIAVGALITRLAQGW